MAKKSQSKNIDLPQEHDHKKIDNMLDKNNPYYPTKVAIENFWDQDLKIKNKMWFQEMIIYL